MAVTGEIFKKLTLDGQSSGDFGVYITGSGVFNAPARDVEMITIPGRNGTFALDNGRFENVEVTYPAGVYADTEEGFARAVSDFRNFLCSRKGYVRLEDEYNPDEYRMAIYKSGLEVDPAKLKAGQFDIVFDCKPQRWLKSGEEPVTIGEWGETETETGTTIEINNDTGDYGIKNMSAEFGPYQSGSGTASPDNIRPLSGRTLVRTYVSETTSASGAHSYLTAFGRTVYGGVLDIITGVLTVDRVAVTLGDISEIKSSGSGTGKYVSFDAGVSLKAGGAVVCDRMKGTTFAQRGRAYEIYQGNSTTRYLQAFVPADATVESVNAAVSGATAVVTLNTPQTYQLEAHELELFSGQNYVWAMVGTTSLTSYSTATVEYGRHASSLVNPTHFDASPLIEVYGYGKISVNGREIEIKNSTIGSTVISQGFNMPFAGGSYTLDLSKFNSGDSFTLKPVSATWRIETDSNQPVANEYTLTETAKSGVDSWYTVDQSYYRDTTKQVIYDIGFTTDELSFTVGQSKTTTVYLTLEQRVNTGSGSPYYVTTTVKLSFTITYDGASTLTFSTAYINDAPTDIYHWPYVSEAYSTPYRCAGAEGTSTKSRLGNPTYIDCETGTSYMIESGKIISLDFAVDLGSVLPKLNPGDNPISKIDDTITRIDVAPRWWKI